MMSSRAAPFSLSALQPRPRRDGAEAFAPCRPRPAGAILSCMKPAAPLASVFLGFGCSSAVNSSSPTSTEPSVATTSRSLLGSLRTRDREVLLYASATGMKVTVKASNGALIADRVDLDALRALDPHLYDICRSG